MTPIAIDETDDRAQLSDGRAIGDERHGRQTAKLWLLKLMGRRPRLWARYLHFYNRLQHLPRRARRRVGRKVAFGLTGVALLLALSSEPVGAATINVANGEVAISNNNKCSLVEAIANADDNNNGQPHDDCTAGNPNGQDTINLPVNGTFSLLTSQGTYFNDPTGLPRVDTKITIEGNGSLITRDAFETPNFRILAVGANGNLTLNNVKIMNGIAQAGAGIYINEGELTINGGSLTYNLALADGGGLFNKAGDVTIIKSLISNNQSLGGGDFGFAHGGGIYTSGTMDITGSSITTNHSSIGGGIYNSETDNIGDLSITASEISGNTASFGGGIYNFEKLNVSDSTLSYNVAGNSGGGIYTHFGTVYITASTLAFNESGNRGGGLFQESGTTTFTNSTLSGNSAYRGGGASNYIADMVFINSTVTGNSADRGGGLSNDDNMTLVRSLVSGNQADYGDEIDNCMYSDCRYNGSADLVAAEFNLFGHNGLTNAVAFVGFTPGATDIRATSNGGLPTPLNKILSPTLKNNGGPTDTHIVVFGSPALDRAPNADCLAAPVDGVDQRGVSRNRDANSTPSGNECDIGAVEKHVMTIDISPFTIPIVLQFVTVPPYVFLDGRREGLPDSARFDAIDVPDPDGETAHLSFLRPTQVPGLGRVPAQDIVTFNGDTFELAFDASDVELAAAGENLDAISFLDGAVSPIGDSCRAYLLLSTKGAGRVTGHDGRPLRFRGEDVLGFCATELGPTTRGQWHLAFDGSAEGLPLNALANLSALDNGQAFFFTTYGNFRADGIVGEKSMVYRFDSDTSLITGPYWAAADVGLTDDLAGLGVSGDLLLEDRP